MSMRKFLKQVGVTSQQEIERVVRDNHLTRDQLKVKAVLTAKGTDLNHVVDDRHEAMKSSGQGPPRAPHAATVE